MLNDETKYKDKFLQFTSDYDRENPLTKKKGELRVLDLKIKIAEESGNKEEVENLKQNKTMVA